MGVVQQRVSSSQSVEGSSSKEGLVKDRRLSVNKSTVLGEQPPDLAGVDVVDKLIVDNVEQYSFAGNGDSPILPVSDGVHAQSLLPLSEIMGVSLSGSIVGKTKSKDVGPVPPVAKKGGKKANKKK